MLRLLVVVNSAWPDHLILTQVKSQEGITTHRYTSAHTGGEILHSHRGLRKHFVVWLRRGTNRDALGA